jgi:hypothetical protein
VKIPKLKRKARIYGTEGFEREVSFFVRPVAQGHSGRELIVDVLNSVATFIPLEDCEAGEFILVNKTKLLYLELAERDLLPETMIALEVSVEVFLADGKTISGSFFVEMPEERSRLSDYLNFSPQFIYLCREKNDIIINKSAVVSVRNA